MVETDEDPGWFDRYDWGFFVLGTGFALLAVVALKYIFDVGPASAGNCYHYYGAPQFQSHGAVYGMDNDGKIIRRGYL